MKRKRMILPVIVLIFLGYQRALAEEKVIREQFSPVVGGLVNFKLPPQAFFTVYTKEEIDSKRSQDAQAIRELQERVANQQQEIKKLSEMNDVLARQVEEIERLLRAAGNGSNDLSKHHF